MTHVTCRLTAKNGISSGTLRSVIEYGLPLLFFTLHRRYRLRFDVSGFDVDSVRVSVSGERIVVRAARLLDSGERRDHIRKVREVSPPAQRSAAQRMCERPIIHRVK